MHHPYAILTMESFLLLSPLLGLRADDMHAMALGLAHSLSRYKLKFSPDKVDTMIVQAIGAWFFVSFLKHIIT
jgi:RNA processing factor Prp31